MNLLAALFAVATASPFGLYHHVTAADLEPPAARQFNLVTMRGDGGTASGAVGELLANRGDTDVFLYRRGTAVSDDEAAELARTHPEFLARTEAGEVVTSNAGGQVIDITNPVVRDWLVGGVARDTQAGAYDGVYLDVLGSFFSSRFYSARPHVNGAPLADAAWRDASIAVITAVKQATGLPVVANGFGIQSGQNYADHRADSDMLIAAADGIQIEQFVRNGNQALDRYKPAARWQEDVELLASVGRMGKIVLANTRVRETSDGDAVDAQRDYALASFLIGAAGPARFRFAEGAATGVVDPSMGKVIDALGPPIADAVETDGTWARQFEGGAVVVDPTAHTVSIDLAGGSGIESSPDEAESKGWRYALGGVALVALVVALGFFAGRRRL